MTERREISMSKKEKNKNKINTDTGENKTERFPNMGGKPTPKKKVKMPPKKRIKLLKTPTQIIRGFTIFLYVLIIFLLTSPFMSATFYITDDLEATTELPESYTYSTQEQIDNAEKELQEALDGLSKDPDYDPRAEKEVSISTLGMAWRYNVASGVDAQDLVALVEKAKNTDRTLYTEESVTKLNNATIKAQRALCSTVTVTRSIIQLILGGNVDGTDISGVGSIVVNVLLIYVLALLPVVGILITLFDRSRHIKNISGMMIALLSLMDIFAMVYPHIAFGSVMTITAYILLFVLSVGGLYAKQQEDYILKHPEKESEFTEKHPQFVKALINYKRVNMKNTIEEEEQKQRERLSKKSSKK